VIEYRVGPTGELIRLVTSLLDPVLDPALAPKLAEKVFDNWQIFAAAGVFFWLGSSSGSKTSGNTVRSIAEGK